MLNKEIVRQWFLDHPGLDIAFFIPSGMLFKSYSQANDYCLYYNLDNSEIDIIYKEEGEIIF